MPTSPPDDAHVMHPSASTHIESRLAAHDVRASFEPNLRIDRIREAEGHQVRFGEHRAPKEMVDRYAEQMKSGATFPAVLVNERYEMVDGNTRLTAARRIGRTTIPAYVCEDLSALQARSLSVELNQSHGLRMTPEELRGFVTSAVEEGQTLDPKAYARMTGVKRSTLSHWVAVKRFEIRAVHHGIPAARLDGLSDSVRAALNVAKLTPVFVAVTNLAIDAQVPAKQLKAIVTQANAAPSETEACALIAHERSVRSEDIRQIATGFKTTRRKGTGSALHIGGLLRFDVADLLDVAPENRNEMFDRMTLLRDRLDGALSRASGEWHITEDEVAFDAGLSHAEAEVR